jgi:hypothetical protein
VFSVSRLEPGGRACAARHLRRSRLQPLDEAQLAHTRAAKIRYAVRAVWLVTRRDVDGDRSLVLLVNEKERLSATCSAQRIVRGGKEHATDPATRVVGMNEEKEHLPVGWMNGRIADHAFRVLNGDEEHVRRLVIGNELLPVVAREQRLGDELAQIRPTGVDGRVEDRPDLGGVCGAGTSKSDPRRVPVPLVLILQAAVNSSISELPSCSPSPAMTLSRSRWGAK